MNIALANNPEWVRHRRALLRPATATAIVVVILLLCVLTVAISDWKVLTGVVILAHLIGLPLWVGLTCSKSITYERAVLTFDCWRTTRLTPPELIIGQLCGVPLMGILAVACTMPIAVMAMTLGIHPLDFVLGYLMLLLFCGTIGLGGLVSSMWASPFRSGRGLVWLLVAYVLISMMSFGGGTVVRQGLGTMTPFHYLSEIGEHLDSVNMNILSSQTTLLFGTVVVPSFVLGVLLNLSFSAWFFLMLQRNIKKNLDELRLLSRWQSVGFAIYVNLFFYLFWNPSSNAGSVGDVSDFDQGLYVLNVITLYLLGIIMLTPHERLRVWWREWSSKQVSYLAEDGLPWPWVMITAICMAGPAYLATTVGEGLSFGFAWHLGIMTMFVVRDVLFLQWCLCQDFKRPLFIGLLYLSLYYFVVQVFFGQTSVIGNVLIPSFLVGVDLPRPIMTIVVQGGIAVTILWGLTQQLKQPSRSFSPARTNTDGSPVSAS